jgi:hypothetical protein
MRWDRLAKDQPTEIAMFQISEVQESPAFNGRRSFLTLREKLSALKKPLMQVAAEFCRTNRRGLAPRVGLEEGANSSGDLALFETGGAESGAVGTQSGSVDCDLQVLITAWPTLSDSVKSEILKLVRNGVSVSRTP